MKTFYGTPIKFGRYTADLQWGNGCDAMFYVDSVDNLLQLVYGIVSGAQVRQPISLRLEDADTGATYKLSAKTTLGFAEMAEEMVRATTYAKSRPEPEHDPRQSRDVVAQVRFAVLGEVTLEDAQEFAATAIAEKLDTLAESAQQGESGVDGLPLFQYNGETCTSVAWDR